MRWWLDEDDEWSFDRVIEFVANFDTVYVGTDSKYHTQGTKFATAIGVYRNPCVTYWHSKEISYSMTQQIKHRLWTEVEKSLEIAWKIRERLPNITIEVHCDINSDTKFPSSTLDSAAMGYVTGCGFVYKNKPGSWCATSCADYHTR